MHAFVMQSQLDVMPTLKFRTGVKDRLKKKEKS